MHPPLDRPHPRCQEEINGLRECHKTGNKLKFWACNDVKTKLDQCFKVEKEEMLKRMNANLDEKKKEEQAQAALAFGKKETFQEFLAKDPSYERNVERERNRQKSWFSMFWV
jgi:COX assembly protein 2